VPEVGIILCIISISAGIGRKMALKFAQMRATVVIWDIFEAGLQQTGSNSPPIHFHSHRPFSD
jgi:hypothetical protein